MVVSTHSAAMPHASFKTVFRRAWFVMLVWQERVRVRRAMAELDGHTLDDIGVSRAAMLFEARKPFWKA